MSLGQVDDDGNGRFAAAARADVPALLALVRELRAENADLRALLGDARDVMASNWTISHRAARAVLARIEAVLKVTP